ncbi:MAG TPA: hypothetical protein VE398_04495 [Acidobacteriota bacterium]|nr:hypothetical protein [Acidobacteriota bacterium]
MNSYWALLEKGTKRQARYYVSPATRDTFLARQTPEFSKPSVTGLEFSEKPGEVIITVTVKRTLPGVGTLDWPVKEKWIFRDGDWFVMIAGTSLPYSSRATGKVAVPLSPEEIERQKKEIMAALRFDRQVIDFGTIRKGKTASSDLKYNLAGSDPMEVHFRDAPSDLIVTGLANQRLSPGDNQVLSMQLITENFDGQVRVPFTVLAKRGDVEVPYQFEMDANVYSPISALPAQLLYLRDERQKELIVRNNSQSEVEIKGIYSGSGVFEVTPLPVVLQPGDKAVLRVSLLSIISRRNYPDMLSLTLARPVEDMQSLIVPVVLNYEKPPVEKRIMGLTQKELNELLKKSPQPPPIKP